MDHLREEYDGIKVPVALVTRQEYCTPIRSLKVFYDFPRRYGWSVSADRDYALEPPENLDESREDPRLNKSEFMQAWLFFGLISFVVQKDGEPILSFENLTTLPERGDTARWLNTTQLPQALKEWQAWELQRPEAAKLRMVRVELALRHAYRVVQTNCAFHDDEPEAHQESHLPNSPLFVSDTMSLSFMILGETLTAAKASIISKLKTQLRGWHKDDDGGWGPPGYVLNKMKDQKWCPRTIHLLKGQLGSNATLLLAALMSHNSYAMNSNRDHLRQRCTKDVCRVISEDDTPESDVEPAGSPKSVYRPKHIRECPRTNCKLVGPDMAEVFQRLRDRTDQNEGEKFPVLEIQGNPDHETLKLAVRTWNLGKDEDGNEYPFATISHVWSDGLGNEDTNEIYNCQLKFIRSLLLKVVDQDGSRTNRQAPTISFWLDTLLIPVRTENETTDIDDFDDLKKRAIRQIYSVFNESEHSIVIDGGLIKTSSHGQSWEVMMRILASGWMRRLWTLQEAYLSKKIWITFQQGAPEHPGIKNLYKLIKDTISSPNAEMARLKLLQNVMGLGRGGRRIVGGGNLGGPRRAILIANTWRAVRWRTTSNPAHETLALATLLSLDYSTTIINQAGLTGRKDTNNADQLGLMMRDFWQRLDQEFTGSIPPGIIFLPGDKLVQEGFRWAPKTWMLALDVDHPDPLSSFNAVAELKKEGLLVQYPGFLLHCQNRKAIFGTDHGDPIFTFPIDRDLLEWYSVEPADKELERKAYLYQILEQAGEKEFAIILSRSRPKERPSEIGLLVEIYRRDPKEDEEQPTEQSTEEEGKEDQEPQWDQGNRKRDIYFCRTIHRVQVWRTRPPYEQDPSEPRSSRQLHRRGTLIPEPPSIMGPPSESTDKRICIGEIIDSDQQWVVDSFEPAQPEESPSEDPDPPGTEIIQPVAEELKQQKTGGSAFFKTALSAFSTLWSSPVGVSRGLLEEGESEGRLITSQKTFTPESSTLLKDTPARSWSWNR